MGVTLSLSILWVSRILCYMYVLVVQVDANLSPGADCSLGRADSGLLRHPSCCPSSVYAFVVINTPYLRIAALFLVAGKGDAL